MSHYTRMCIKDLYLDGSSLWASIAWGEPDRLSLFYEKDLARHVGYKQALPEVLQALRNGQMYAHESYDNGAALCMQSLAKMHIAEDVPTHTEVETIRSEFNKVWLDEVVYIAQKEGKWVKAMGGQELEFTAIESRALELEAVDKYAISILGEGITFSELPKSLKNKVYVSAAGGEEEPEALY